MRYICISIVATLALAGTSFAQNPAITWGNNGQGQCIVPVGETFVEVVAGSDYSIGLRADGTAIAWGRNDNGQCNVPAGEIFVQVAAGGGHSIGLRADGTAIAWGQNSQGQCNVPAGEIFSKIAAGGYFNIGLRADGTAIAWGYNYSGELNVPAGETFVQVAAGSSHNIGLRGDGTAIAWGRNDSGQCNVPAGEIFVDQVVAGQRLLHRPSSRRHGNRVGTQRQRPMQRPCWMRSLCRLLRAAYHTIGLRADGTVIAWGYINNGPLNPPPCAGETFVQVAAGLYHTSALSPNNADCDFDDDNFQDWEDAFPNDPNEWYDIDGDGMGDNEDNMFTSSRRLLHAFRLQYALTSQACAGMGGTWLGEGGSCDDCPASCMGDTDGNGVVNIEDLLNMLGSWGACP